MTTITSIARSARATLGRPAYRSRRWADFAAADAIAAAARQHGFTAPLGAWVQCGRPLRQMALDYVSRYCQAYGPTAGYIDLGAHLGMAKPALARPS